MDEYVQELFEEIAMRGCPDVSPTAFQAVIDALACFVAHDADELAIIFLEANEGVGPPVIMSKQDKQLLSFLETLPIDLEEIVNGLV